VRDRSPSPSFYTTFAIHEREGGIPSPSKKYGEESPGKRSATRYGEGLTGLNMNKLDRDSDDEELNTTPHRMLDLLREQTQAEEICNSEINQKKARERETSDFMQPTRSLYTDRKKEPEEESQVTQKSVKRQADETTVQSRYD
jgi:hypothetical protein